MADESKKTRHRYATAFEATIGQTCAQDRFSNDTHQKEVVDTHNALPTKSESQSRT
jgi:hypothetical protein